MKCGNIDNTSNENYYVNGMDMAEISAGAERRTLSERYIFLSPECFVQASRSGNRNVQCYGKYLQDMETMSYDTPQR